jgi:hypothetical protein
MDVERAVDAFTRLLDAIEIRLPSNSTHSTHVCGHKQPSLEGIDLPYSESVIKASLEADSFLECFLSALPIRHLNFRYIAPRHSTPKSDRIYKSTTC